MGSISALLATTPPLRFGTCEWVKSYTLSSVMKAHQQQRLSHHLEISCWLEVTITTSSFGIQIWMRLSLRSCMVLSLPKSSRKSTSLISPRLSVCPLIHQKKRQVQTIPNLKFKPLRPKRLLGLKNLKLWVISLRMAPPTGSLSLKWSSV